MRSPILFLVFNRPDTTAQVFEAIRAARPSKLYVAADGPRPERIAEAAQCAQVRHIATNVDWPCEVHTLFREQNLGCKTGVSGGINWFFAHEEEGIILEDDIMPLPSFFPYCDQLLARYRDDERIAMISGCNLISNHFRPNASYFFSRYTHIWGWATWRRAWQHYDVTMKAWPQWHKQHGLATLKPGNVAAFEAYWKNQFNAVQRCEIDTWDYQWLFTCWKQGALAILPADNQTHNLGFGAEATHTTADAPAYVKNSIPVELSFPLVHPPQVARDREADQWIDQVVFRLNRFNALLWGILNIPLLGTMLRRLKAKK